MVPGDNKPLLNMSNNHGATHGSQLDKCVLSRWVSGMLKNKDFCKPKVMVYGDNTSLCNTNNNHAATAMALW